MAATAMSSPQPTKGTTRGYTRPQLASSFLLRSSQVMAMAQRAKAASPPTEYATMFSYSGNEGV